MKKCDCGESSPSEFYGKGHKKCKACLKIYNAEQYQLKKDTRTTNKRLHVAKSNKCLDVVSLTVMAQVNFQRTCEARRSIPPQKHYRRSISCHVCSLAAKVDAGFLPVNIHLMKISLMARMN